MFTDTRQALLDAIRDNPEDDAPRLIYADWLDENGDPNRAKFIRLQCEYARLPYWHPQRDKLGKESDRIFKKHRNRWLVGIPRAGKGYFSRGFLYEVPLTSTQFLRSIRGIWKSEPVATVCFRGPVNEFITAIQDPLVKELRGIRIAGVEYDEGAALHALTECPHLAELRELTFLLTPTKEYRTDTLDALRAWQLPKLRRLYVSCRTGSLENAAEPLQRAIIGGKLLATVEDASLLDNEGATTAEAFTNAPTANLRRLWVTGYPNQRWWETLLKSPCLANLERLATNSYGVAPNVLSAFYASPLLGHLTRLSLHTCDWSSASVVEFVQSPRVQQMQELYLSGNKNLTDETAEAIIASLYLKNLRYLALSATSVTHVGADRLRAMLPNVIVSH